MKAQENKTLDQIGIDIKRLLEQEMAKISNKDKMPKQFLVEFVKKLPPDHQKYVLLELFSLGVTAAQLDCKPEDIDDPKSFIGRFLQEGVMKIASDSDGSAEPHFQLTEKGRELYIEILFPRKKKPNHPHR